MDEVTYPATERLFARAKGPRDMLALTDGAIAKTIYPVGFYRTKARQIRAISKILLARHDGRVPDTIDELLLLPGVGRKTANLTVTLGFGKPGICVDTHVHRIANRLGWSGNEALPTTPKPRFAARSRSAGGFRSTRPWCVTGSRSANRSHPFVPVCAVSRRCPRIERLPKPIGDTPPFLQTPRP